MTDYDSFQSINRECGSLTSRDFSDYLTKNPFQGEIHSAKHSKIKIPPYRVYLATSMRDAGISIEELAKEIKTSPTRVKKFLTGEAYPGNKEEAIEVALAKYRCLR